MSAERPSEMDKFTVLEGVAAPLKMINVDTDMIIPKQYLKTIKRTGLAFQAGEFVHCCLMLPGFRGV